MPYNSIIDLLDDAQIDFPKRAQRIYREAYDKAWDEYGDPDGSQGPPSREEVAHRAGWHAVEDKYEKGPGGTWREKGNRLLMGRRQDLPEGELGLKVRSFKIRQQV